MKISKIVFLFSKIKKKLNFEKIMLQKNENFENCVSFFEILIFENIQMRNSQK